MNLNPKNLKNVDFKQLALRHGEKAAMVLCGLFLIWGVYSFFGAGSTEYSPNELRDKVELAKKHIDENENPDKPPAVGNFSELAKERTEEPVELTSIAWANSFYRPPQGRGQRSRPVFLAPQHGLASADTMTVEVKAAPGALVRQRRIKPRDDDTDEKEPEKEPVRDVKPYRFASVRFLAPWKEQISEFAKAHVGGTLPDYLDVKLQRRRLGSDGNWSEWEPVDTSGKGVFAAEFGKWVGQVELVTAQFLSPVLTYPLPTKLTGDWEQHGTHPKLVMLALQQPEQTLPAQQQQPAATGKQQNRGGAANLTKNSAASSGGVVGGAGGLSGATQFRRMPLAPQQGQQQGDNLYGGNDPAGANSAFGQGQGQGQGSGQGFGGNQGFGGTAPPAGQLPQSEQQREPQGAAQGQGPTEWLLFRFLDLTVEAGQTYQYRLKLVVANPNYGVDQDLLQDGNKSLAENEKEETPWSEPTDPLVVPSDVCYLLADGSIDPEERSVELDLFVWDTELGSLAADRKDETPRPLKSTFSAGDPIGIDAEPAKLVDFTTNMKKEKRVSAATNDIVIAFDGGRESLDLGPDFPPEVRELDLPQILLALDAHGQWVTHHERTDYHRWVDLNARLTAQQESAEEEEKEDDKKTPQQPIQGAGQGQVGNFGGFSGFGQGQQQQGGNQGQKRRKR